MYLINMLVILVIFYFCLDEIQDYIDAFSYLFPVDLNR